jgi:hypothetical protein
MKDLLSEKRKKSIKEEPILGIRPSVCNIETAETHRVVPQAYQQTRDNSTLRGSGLETRKESYNEYGLN